MASRCCVCKRHVPLYMMVGSDNVAYEDPIVVGASFICKKCWDKKEYKKFIE